MSKQSSSLVYAAIGCTIAVGVTTTMDATGFAAFSALPLFGIVVLLWIAQKFSFAELGFSVSHLNQYGIALLYPLVVLGCIALIAFVAGVVDTSQADWSKTSINLALGSTIGCIMVLITEELFFRGWLWATLQRASLKENTVLLITTLVFTVWHISWALLPTGFRLPPGQVVIYLVNVVLLGGIWGVMRMMSNSVLVPSVSHAVWNAAAYSFYGIGSKVGDLGIERTEIYGPEIGIMGIGFNLLFLSGLWTWRLRKMENKFDHRTSGNAEDIRL